MQFNLRDAILLYEVKNLFLLTLILWSSALSRGLYSFTLPVRGPSEMSLLNMDETSPDNQAGGQVSNVCSPCS